MELAVELASAFLLALAAGGLAAASPAPVFAGVLGLGLVLLLPCLAAVLLLSPAHGIAPLALLLLPGAALACRRVSRARLDAARGLGANRLLVARALVLPVLAPPLLLTLLGGVAVLGVKHRLERVPAGSFELPDPPTGIG